MVNALILAAGEGTRMKSKRPKVLHTLYGKALIEWSLDSVAQLCGKPMVVVGHGADAVKRYLGDRAHYVLQSERKGTGHAVMMAKEYLQACGGYVVVLAGDVPLIRKETIAALIESAKGSAASILTVMMQDPAGYGRILRDESGAVCGIIEEKDANEAEKKICEINSGIYCLKTEALLWALDRLENSNAQGEYYLTDCIGLLSADARKVHTYTVQHAEEAMGVNDRFQLALAGEVLRRRINRRHCENGVGIQDVNTAYIDDGVTIGADTLIQPNVTIKGDTKIGCDCVIGTGSVIEDCIIGDGVAIRSSELEQSVVGDGVKIGPFAHLRPNSDIGAHCKLGNFVEIKNSRLGEDSKVSHLTYVGDSDVGRGVNIGCGVVFVNYDGCQKARSVVKDNAFIGCNTNLVSPVTVGEGAYIAAGSTITEDVPNAALAIARARQINKPGWKKVKD
ncbi:MAG: bifunctional UDP-N-acetylglucosamine diphosphorylase/glucosamine-1-phosphate N-acetyltransferase GlmU [Christensenellales bacterium]